MKWESELNRALRELAQSTSDRPGRAETERLLLQAFDRRYGAGSRASVPVVPAPGTTVASLHRARIAWHRWHLAAAAAALVLVLGGWWELQGPGRELLRPAADTVAVEPVLAPPSALGRTDSSGVATGAALAATRSGPASRRAPAPTRAARRVAPEAPLVKVGDEEPGEFVTLPAAELLPPLESGMVVRVELPVTSLPAYGFPIMPDSSPLPVTADVLVGQDGQPRAIRLVALNHETRRR